MMSKISILLSSLLINLLILSGCATTEDAASTEDTPSDLPKKVAMEAEELAELRLLLDSNRSQLKDVYTTQHHDMPSAFLKEQADDTDTSNPYTGYRVQIISTRNVELADSVKIDFSVWADSTIKGYTAQSYVFFNQPYYKVHVGDFQERNRANHFSQLVKNKYPEAWVVHDRIKPEHTPVDTATFSLKTEKDRLQERQKDTLKQQ